MAGADFIASIAASFHVLAHLLKVPYFVLNRSTRCHNSSFQIHFCLNRGLVNEIPDVPTKEEVPVTISAFRGLSDGMCCVSNCSI